MTDEPERRVVEAIPSVQGGVSAIGSTRAPIIYFDNAPGFGILNGIGMVVLEAARQNVLPDNNVALDRVMVAHLRASIPAIKALRAALDGILLMAEPKPAGEMN